MPRTRQWRWASLLLSVAVLLLTALVPAPLATADPTEPTPGASVPAPTAQGGSAEAGPSTTPSTPEPTTTATAGPSGTANAPEETPSPSATQTSSSASSSPTIVSDQGDYPPGGTVTLTGSGWRPGETVTVFVNDTGGLSWNLTQTVVADAEGSFRLTFTLPDRYVPDYDVTATGEASGVATTTFTDAATGAWQYWMTQSSPSPGNVVAGDVITYTLNARSNDCNPGCTNVAGASMTLTLTGSASFSDGTKTYTWSPGTLTRTGSSTTVSATVSATAAVGSTIQASIAMAGGSTQGVFWSNSGTQYQTRIHTVAAVTVNTCHFATSGSGAYADSICWFDLTGYSRATATSRQRMQQVLPGGYTLTYNITVSGAEAAARTFPTWSGSYLGNTASGVGGYYGVTGMPAIYQSAGGTTTLTLSDIVLRNSAGIQVTGFALVGADAESTDQGESITWTSTAPFTSIGPLGNACGTGLVGVGTTTVTCNGATTAVGNKTGTAILYSKDPATFTQSMVGSGLQGVAFGVMVAGVQLKKAVVNPVTSADAFTISVAGGGVTLATATANSGSNWVADSGKVLWILSGSSQSFTMSESAGAGTTAANYTVSWACTKNGDPYAPSGESSNSKTVTLTSFSDFIVCTITNTGPTLTLRKNVDNTGGAPLTPANWTLSAKAGNLTAISQAPTNSPSTSGSVSSASTATVAVPVGTAFTLAESSTANGAGGYAASSWSCTNAGTGSFTLSGSVLTLNAGNKVTCTITNTAIKPTIALWKATTASAGGPFGFALTNTDHAVGSVTTAAADTRTQVDADPVASGVQPFTATSFTADVTISEQALPSGWTLAGASCTNGAAVVGSLTGSTYTIPAAALVPGAQITCDWVNRPINSTVNWSKVDAGSTSVLLRGSEWTLTGPSFPQGTTVTDCVTGVAGLCTGLDKDPAAGAFSVGALQIGSYTLTETRAPAGFVLDSTPHTFVIAASDDGATVQVGAITNQRVPVPAIPLTGGPSTDAFHLIGAALFALAVAAAWRQRRRALRQS